MEEITRQECGRDRLYFAFMMVLIIIGALALPALVIMPSMNFKKTSSLAGMEMGLKPNVANAMEIYPEFVCGCCGKPLDPKNICCGMSKQMIDFIDGKVYEKRSKNDVMLLAIKEYGFDSLAKKETKESIKLMMAENAPVDAPKIVAEKKSIDLGAITQEGGVVTALLDFRNEGESDLVIDKISTSCGCTSALIVYEGKEGPAFTMPGHGKENPQGWSVSIKPGDSAQLKVYYDPNAHGKQKEAKMDITRTIDVFSNDPVDFQKQFRIDLVQLP